MIHGVSGLISMQKYLGDNWEEVCLLTCKFLGNIQNSLRHCLGKFVCISLLELILPDLNVVMEHIVWGIGFTFWCIKHS